VSYDRSRNRTATEANDGRAVPGFNAYQRRAQAQPITELANCSGAEQMGPGVAYVLLFVVLLSGFADDDVLVVQNLPRILPAKQHIIRVSPIPVESSRVILQRTIEADTPGESACVARVVRHEIGGKTIDH